ncbi:hypothetical protein Q8A67_020740 [Cirrhinus molitorella]|uniref:Uncharacterized protein n=1 Tax=Cirrhinus molitorella TaxID=172907 RepID=A0AA88PD37_9TELE|nr:hypothetical protein Q8A67_020740 [Cirrhinus molitorella]
MTKEQVCRTEITKDCLSVYTVSCQPTCEVNEITAPVAINETNDATVEEPYPGFEAQVQQILKDADAIQDETDLQKLRQILYQYKASFAKDSLDCGLTHLHTIANGDLVSLQASDTSILTVLNHLKDPSSYPIASTDLNQVPGLKRLHHIRYLLHVTDNILWDYNFTLSPELEMRIAEGGPQLIDITPIDQALQALGQMPALTNLPVVRSWTAADTALCLSTAIGYALTLGLAFILYRKVNEMQEFHT